MRLSLPGPIAPFLKMCMMASTDDRIDITWSIGIAIHDHSLTAQRCSCLHWEATFCHVWHVQGAYLVCSPSMLYMDITRFSTDRSSCMCYINRQHLPLLAFAPTYSVENLINSGQAPLKSFYSLIVMMWVDKTRASVPHFAQARKTYYEWCEKYDRKIH